MNRRKRSSATPVKQSSSQQTQPSEKSPKIPTLQKLTLPSIESSQNSQQISQPKIVENFNNLDPEDGEALNIPDDPLQEFQLPKNFFVPKDVQNLGVGKLGEPRLIIHHISNENFKSYANTVVLGPFHQNFTAIIGPNGSGKSNVIDSLLFVFAFSAKRIRLKNLAGLIHNSDAVKKNPPKSATVTIHFQTIIDDLEFPGEKYTTVEGSKFEISRTCFKDGGSVYKINNKKTQMKQIKQRLKQEGIDLDHNRFLILQGEVEQIALMKPKGQTEHDEGMLEYLEDIMGTNRYKIPVEKLKEHTEVLSEMRSSKLERVAATEQEVLALKGARDEANTYLKQLNEVTKKKHLQCQIKIQSLLKELQNITQQYTTKSENYRKLQEDQKTDRIGLKKSEKELTKISKAFDKVSKLLESVSATCKQLEKEQQDLIHENTGLEKSKTKNEKEIISLENKLKKLEKEPEKLQNKIEKLEEEKVELKNEESEAQDNLNEKMKELSGKTDQLQSKKSSLEGELLEHQNIVTGMNTELKLVQEELKLITSNYTKIKNSYDSAVTELENFKSLDKTENETKNLTETIENLNGEIEVLQKDISQLKTHKNAQNFDQKLSLLDSQLHEKREILSSATRTSSGNKMTDFFKKMQSEGKLGNGKFYGRLGDLASIDKSFDIAISTGAGPLDHYVCDSNDTATACISLLKKYNKGQASFIALNKMEVHRKRCNKISTPFNAPRLFDQIQISDEKFAPAFWYAVQDTLVAENMEEARSFTKKERWRVVTKSGELIETTGAMTGGGGRVKSGRMGHQAVQVNSDDDINIDLVQNEILNLENKIKQIDCSIRQIDDDILEKEKELRSRKSLHLKCTNDLDKLNREATKNATKLENLKAIIPKLEKDMVKAKPKSSETKMLDDKIITLSAKFKEATIIVTDTQQKINSVQDDIIKQNDQIQGPAKQWLKEVREKISKNQKELTKSKGDINKSERNKNLASEKIKLLQDEIQTSTTRLSEIEERMSTLEIETKEEIQKEIKYKSGVKELEEQKFVYTNECSKCRKNITEAEAKLIDFKHEVKTLKSQKFGLEHQMSLLEEELNGYVLEKIDDDEIEEDDQVEMENAPNEEGKETDETTSPTGSKLKILPTERLEQEDVETIQKEIFILQESIAKLKGRVNIGVIQEYRMKEAIYQKRISELEKITKLRNDKRSIGSKLEQKRADEFLEGFNQIKLKLKEVYQMITLGGDADLELVDNLNPFSEGVEFSVRPPNKSWKKISNLSGGEKTLSSLALVFALHYYKPTPFYVMDEIDAALDYRNVGIIAKYIRERTKNAQFIIISLRNIMFEQADRLVGIYKVNDMTNTATINPNNFNVVDEKKKVKKNEKFTALATKKSLSQQNKENVDPI